MREIKERPILFSAPMVRALLDGTKTQTRRSLKLPKNCSWYNAASPTNDGFFTKEGHEGYWHAEELSCPYGKIGDRLWVRETFAYGLCTKEPYAYRATHKASDLDEGWDEKIKWTPSIHMPRIASRITLEITGVKVERLNDISDTDAGREGCGFYDSIDVGSAGGFPSLVGTKTHWTAKECFMELWESINGPESWAANPWVWVVEFKRITP